MATEAPVTSPHAVMTALYSVSAAVAHSACADELLDSVLDILLGGGLICAGIAEVQGGAAPRMVGEEVDLAALRAAITPAGRSRRPDAVCRTVPTRAAPCTRLCLLSSSPLEGTFVQAVSDQIALGLDRLALSEQTQTLQQQADRRIMEVSTIYEIGRAIDSVELDILLEIITEKAAKVMDAQACSLMRLNPDTNALTIAASYGLSEDVVLVSHRTIGEGIAGRVAATGEPLLIAEAQSDPRLSGLPLRPDIGSSMVVPMKDENGKVTGVLSIRRRRPAPDFTDEDLRLFSVFASQAALAINNKQLYDDLRRHVKELSTLSDLTTAVISHLDLGSLLDNLADNIVDVVQFDRCCIYLLDRNIRRFVPRIIRGYRPEIIGRNPVRVGEGVVGIVAKKQMPIVESNARSALQPMRGFARALGTSSFLAIPIISKGQSIGVVVADNKLSGRTIHAQNVELLTTFVNQAGIAIENAQLYEEREQRYQDMNRLATQTDNILRSIAATVVVVDAQDRIARWSEATEELWGIPEEEATGLSFADLVQRFELPPDEVDQLLVLRQHVRESGRPYQMFKVALHPQRRGETYVNILLSPLIDRQGERQGVVLVIEDVTHEVKMEVEIGRIRRLADIGQLAAKMAHEVRNPLSSIKGAAQLMRNEYEDLAPFREFLDIIIDEVNHLSKITSDLLDFARPLQLDPQWTNVNDLAERTLHFLKGMLKEAGVKIRFRPDGTIPHVSADPKQIEQVMRNIVINAAQAMPEGGDLTVTSSYDPEEEAVTVVFADTGSGITAERIDEIFQPFFTTKTKGTGLGLPIVRRIVESHGGRIEVSSARGEGARFSVTLPMQTASTAVPGSADVVEPSITAGLPDM
jgi:PAS domain S-box-containing protein